MTDTLSIVRQLVEVKAGVEPYCAQIYKGECGKTWQLLRHTTSGTLLVREIASAADGGAATEMTLEQFLAKSCVGPEHEALRLLLAAAEVQTAVPPKQTGAGR